MASPKATDDTKKGDEPVAGGTIYSNKDGEDDGTYIEVGNGEIADISGPSPWADWEWGEDYTPERIEVGLEGAKIEVNGSLAHGKYTYDSDPPKQRKVTYRTVTLGSKPPMVATLGDPTFHGSPLLPGTGSPDVYSQGKPVFRMLRDLVACTAATPAPHVGGVVLPTGPPTGVFVNGFPIARVGDSVMEALGGPNPILFAETKTVFAGKPAPPVTTVHPVPDVEIIEDEKSWTEEYLFDVEGSVEVDLEVAKTEGSLGGGVALDVDDLAAGGDIHVNGSGELVHAKTHTRSEVTVFGTWTFEVFDWEWEGGAGKWKGHADVVADPVQKRIDVDGDLDFGEED